MLDDGWRRRPSTIQQREELCEYMHGISKQETLSQCCLKRQWLHDSYLLGIILTVLMPFSSSAWTFKSVLAYGVVIAKLRFA